MEFLFVRWFSLDTEDSERGGWKAKKLHQIGFVEGDAAFGFVDPSDVIRAIHLIPQSLGQFSRKMRIGFVITSICRLFQLIFCHHIFIAAAH